MLEYANMERIINHVEKLDSTIKIPAKYVGALTVGSWLQAKLDIGELSLMQLFDPIEQFILPIYSKSDAYIEALLKTTIQWIRRHHPSTLGDIVMAHEDVVEMILNVVEIWTDYRNTYPRVQIYESWCTKVDVEKQWIQNRLSSYYTHKNITHMRVDNPHGFEPFIPQKEVQDD